MNGFMELASSEPVLEFSWIIAGVVALLSGTAWVACLAMRNHAPARRMIASCALIGCLAVPALTGSWLFLGRSLVSAPVLVARPRVRAVGVNLPVAESTPAGSTVYQWRRSERLSDVDTLIPTNPTLTAPAWRVAGGLSLMGWAVGTVWMLGRLIRSCREIRGLRREAEPVADPELRRLLTEVCRGRGLRREPLLAVSRRARAPFVAGASRPMVLLPAALVEAGDLEAVRDVLTHEVAHIREGDHVMISWQEFARALYWPIPTVHALARAIARAREELCDDHVLADRDPIAYGETLLRLAEMAIDAPAPSTAVGVLGGRGELERRVARVLTPGRRIVTRCGTFTSTLVFLSCVLLVTTASATRFVASPFEASWQMYSHPLAPGELLLQPNASGHAPQRISINHRPPPLGSLLLQVRPGRAISFVVRNEEGEPIPGVRVRITPESLDSPDQWIDLYPGPAGTVRGAPVTTDSQGRWSAKFSWGGWVRLLLTHSDYVRHEEWGDFSPFSEVPPEDLEAGTAVIVMKQGVNVFGRVLDPEGRPIAGAEVTAWRFPSTTRRNKALRRVVIYPEWLPRADSDREGRYRLPLVPHGETTIQVDVEGWPLHRQTISLSPGMEPINFRLEPGRDLKVRFVDRDGRGVPDLKIRPMALNRSHQVSLKIPHATDSRGDYRWTWAPEGPLTYEVTGADDYPWSITLVADGTEQTVVLHDLPTD